MLMFRMEFAGDLFLCATLAERVVGFVCGTRSNATHVTQESMGSHEPDGSLLVIHSVCVAPDLRRLGVATRLLAAYLRFAAERPQLTQVRLICKEHLKSLYSRVGFKLLGLSSVVHA
jgi:predicted GNAT family N-acyltransferase